MTTATWLRAVFGGLQALAGAIGLLVALRMRRRGVEPQRDRWRVWALGWVLVVCGLAQVALALLTL